MHYAMGDWLLSGAVVKNPPANAGGTRDVGLIPGCGRSHGEGNGNPLQYPCLENPQEEPGELQSVGLQRVRHNRAYKHKWDIVSEAVGLNRVSSATGKMTSD